MALDAASVGTNAAFIARLTATASGGIPVTTPSAAAQFARTVPGSSSSVLLNASADSQFVRVANAGNSTMRTMTRYLPYVAVAIDVVSGVHSNVSNNTPERILPDAIVDVAVTGASVYVGGKAAAGATAVAAALMGAKKGATAGTFVTPIAGTIIGAVVGAGIGVALYYFTDFRAPGGYTMRENAQNALNEQLFGND